MRNSNRVLMFGLFVVFVLSVCCTGCKRTALTINADKSYDGRTINLRVGGGVKLSLEENPTTGYRWEFLTKLEPVCVVVSDAYVAGGGAIGSGGVHDWVFRAVAKGTASVKLGYRRPWEKDTAPAQTFTLTIAVK